MKHDIIITIMLSVKDSVKSAKNEKIMIRYIS